MSFRLRVTLFTAAAVAVAAIGASVAMYLVVQDQLIKQVDDNLQAAASGPVREPGGPFRRGPGDQQVSNRPEVFGQIINASGTVVQGDGGYSIPALVTAEVKNVAAGKASEFYATAVSGDVRVQIYVKPIQGGAIEVVQPLRPIDAALGQTRLLLIVEEVTKTRDLSRRVAARGRDELSRLGTSFDAMLGQLETSLRSQRQLVADASHELRTPLTALRTNLELLERGQPTDPVERQQLLGDLVTQMERLTTLVGDLIEVARDEETPMPFEELKLDEVVHEVVDDVSFRYPRVRFNVTSSPSSINGVKVRVARAITNLLDNAAKYSPAGATVDVTVANGEISVRDHGPGVAAEDASRVFDRFWRSNDARHLPGSGLGLSIVKDVAESHGGSVTLERPIDGGGGARFRLRLKGA